MKTKRHTLQLYPSSIERLRGKLARSHTPNDWSIAICEGRFFLTATATDVARLVAAVRGATGFEGTITHKGNPV